MELDYTKVFDLLGQINGSLFYDAIAEMTKMNDKPADYMPDCFYSYPTYDPAEAKSFALLKHEIALVPMLHKLKEEERDRDPEENGDVLEILKRKRHIDFLENMIDTFVRNRISDLCNPSATRYEFRRGTGDYKGCRIVMLMRTDNKFGGMIPISSLNN